MKNVMNYIIKVKRIEEVNDLGVMCQEGVEQYAKGDYRSAFEYLAKAAGLGDIKAHYQLLRLYGEGECVEKDEKRELHLPLEEAVITTGHTSVLDTILNSMRC